MTLIVDRSETRTDRTATLEATPERRRIDVTDLRAAGIESFVESNVDTEFVSLEHRGGRTYLVLED